MVSGVKNNLLEQTFSDFNLRLWDVPEPFCFKGVHIAELQAFMYFEFGKLFAIIERFPTIECHYADQELFDIWNKASREFIFNTIISEHIGILLGGKDNLPHAVAWDGKKIYDPQGEIYKLEDKKFSVEEALILL